MDWARSAVRVGTGNAMAPVMRRVGEIGLALFLTVACGGNLETNTGGGGGGGSGGDDIEGGGEDGDGICAELAATGSVSQKPVDVIVIIDNSSSMTAEIAGVVDNISVNFTEILTAAGVDWRVIMLSYHGDPAVAYAEVDNAICVRSPLSGTSCSPVPAAPVNTERFYHHSIAIDSTDSLQQMLASYPAWSGWLRPDATRAILEITDDLSDLPANQFETQLFALTPSFGSATARNFVFHSIIGIHEKTPPSDAWLPSEPMQNVACASASDPSPQYEELSIRTGGLRFPVCQTASYDAVFQRIAAGVIEGTQLGCRFAAPAPPAGQTLDLSSVEITYQPSSGAALETLVQVGSAADCAPGAFYVEASDIALCPETCSAIEADPTGRLEVKIPCQGATVD
jgi:hypothetical protein